MPTRSKGTPIRSLRQTLALERERSSEMQERPWRAEKVSERRGITQRTSLHDRFRQELSTLTHAGYVVEVKLDDGDNVITTAIRRERA